MRSEICFGYIVNYYTYYVDDPAAKKLRVDSLDLKFENLTGENVESNSTQTDVIIPKVQEE